MKEDHRRAGQLAKSLLHLPYVESVAPADTNIVVFRLKDQNGVPAFLERLRQEGILALAFGPGAVRFVTHLEIDDAAVERAIVSLQKIAA